MASVELTLLAQAEEDLIELRRYSLGTFGKAAADRYVDDIRSVFLLLSENPRVGTERLDVGPGIRSFSKRQHRIIYRIVGENVQIVRVLHHSRDIFRHLAP